MKAIYFATVVTFCSLYAAQPIQPLFQQEFQLTNFQALLFTTLMMAPLGIAPLFYGFILEAVSAKVMVRWALLILGVLELLFAFAADYAALLLIRAVQGLMIPAILTSLMSYISYSSQRDKVQQAIATYVGATILGGFLGRFLSGLFTDLFGWRFFFFILGILLITNSIILKSMVRNVKMNYSRPQIPEILDLLKERMFLWLYVAIFCLFFVFAAMMNFVPFELKRLLPSSGETGVGFLYLGYSMGLLVSLNSGRVIRWCRGAVNGISIGIVIFAVGCVMFSTKVYAVMFGAMFVFCLGLFTAHSLLSGAVNRLAKDNKAIANGLYICFYYTGGTLGSILPAALYEEYGWNVFLGQLLVMIGVAFWFTRCLASVLRQRGMSI